MTNAIYYTRFRLLNYSDSGQNLTFYCYLDFPREFSCIVKIMNAVEYPLWVWIFFFVVVLVALFIDVGIVNRKAHAPSRKETIVWSAVWISLALIFNGFILMADSARI